MDEFVGRCVTWNERFGYDHPILKLLKANGDMFKPIHKIRSDANGTYRPRDLPKQTYQELRLKLQGLDHVDQEGYIRFALPCMISKMCELTGLGKHKGAFELAISQGGIRVLQFHDTTFANMFYCRYNGFHDEQGGRLIRWTLGNDAFSAIANKEPQLMMLKSASDVIDVQVFEQAVDGVLFDRAALSS